MFAGLLESKCGAKLWCANACGTTKRALRAMAIPDA
jgi:hypothetical protein